VPEILREPIGLSSGQTLENRSFLLAQDFRWNSWQSVVFGNQVEDVVIRNVTLLGSQVWQERWNQANEGGGPPGIHSAMSGIKLQGASRARIESCRIEGFPKFGIYVHGFQDGQIRDLQVRHCFQGIRLGNVAPNPRVRIEHIVVRDTWGPGAGLWPGVAGAPSVERPGEFIGSDGIAAEHLTDSLVLDFQVLGECYTAFKFSVGCKDLELVQLFGNCLQLDGGTTGEGITGARFLACTLDKSLAVGAVSDQGQALQISNRVQVKALRSLFRSDGHGGHGVQVHGATADIRECTFSGFNGNAGITPAHAAQTAAGGVLNEDFASVNRFTNQQRIWLRG